MRKSGVVFFATVINRIIGKDLTDTSNGYRAFRTEVLADLTLEQDQYQTAEVIITAAARGWRITEVPTVWHPRTSGESKKGHNIYFGMQYAGSSSVRGGASITPADARFAICSS